MSVTFEKDGFTVVFSVKEFYTEIIRELTGDNIKEVATKSLTFRILEGDRMVAEGEAHVVYNGEAIDRFMEESGRKRMKTLLAEIAEIAEGLKVVGRAGMTSAEMVERCKVVGGWDFSLQDLQKSRDKEQ